MTSRSASAMLMAQAAQIAMIFQTPDWVSSPQAWLLLANAGMTTMYVYHDAASRPNERVPESSSGLSLGPRCGRGFAWHAQARLARPGHYTDQGSGQLGPPRPAWHAQASLPLSRNSRSAAPADSGRVPATACRNLDGTCGPAWTPMHRQCR